MKLNRYVSLWVLAIAGLTAVTGTVSAQTTTPSTTTATTAPAQGHKWHGRFGGGGLLLGITLHAAKQLNLTAEQEASIKTILSNAHAQAKAAHATGNTALDMAVLGNPGDPNYATALQSAKTLAANRIQTESELQGQIYNVLTAEQKAQLPTVLASMKAKAEARRAALEEKRATGNNRAG
jgi:Spy/CpxP family protein refolding chaperone